jgi:hypothetical protein
MPISKAAEGGKGWRQVEQTIRRMKDALKF